MGQNKLLRLGPLALTNAAANLFNPGTTTGGVNSGTPQNMYAVIKHIRVVNKTGGAVTVSLYVGATGGSAAGTEFAWNAASVPANGSIEWFGAMPMDVGDFLTGLASANTSLTIEGEGEIGIR